MGLDFYYTNKQNKQIRANFRFSYSGFNKFRKEIGEYFNIDLDKMYGYCNEEFCNENCNKCKKVIHWDTINDDIKILLHHSDCDGYIKYNDLKLLLPRLKYVVKEFEKLNYNYFVYPDRNWFITKLEKLILFIEECIENEADLIFT